MLTSIAEGIKYQQNIKPQYTGAWELLATTNIVGINNRYQSLKLPTTGTLLN